MKRQLLSYPQIFRDWLLTNNQPHIDNLQAADRRPALFFVFCLVAYCLYLLAMQPDWVLGGGMWAESATNYFHYSISTSITERFFSTDAGYIPLPQRILAYLAIVLHMPASAIPYFYTWSAMLITASMVGAFCLKPFRALVRNDFLRLFAAIAVLLIADFETRTFINFTYFSAFLITIVTALAFVEKSAEVPRWSWIIPLFMISKPAVLSALPAMIVAALVSKTRFRLITAAATILCLAQLTTMFFAPVKAMAGTSYFSTPEKLQASIQYFLGFLGAISIGPTASANHYWPIGIGVGVLLLCLFTILRQRTSAGTLILTGLGILLFNVTVHCFAFSANWNIDMARLKNFHVERHMIVGYAGVILLITGLIAATFDAGVRHKRSWATHASPAVFLAWFFVSGWLAYSAPLNRAPESPLLNNSHWQAMASAIDSGEAVCVPVDPLGIMFQRDCKLLNLKLGWLVGWIKTFTFEPMQAAGSGSEMTLQPPPSDQGNNLISLALLLKPRTAQSLPLDAEAVFKMQDGTTERLTGTRQLPGSGGLVMLTGARKIPVDEIQAVTFISAATVDLGHLVSGTEKLPLVFWMGN